MHLGPRLQRRGAADVVEDLILCMTVPPAGDACGLQVEQTKCIRWEQLLFPQVRHPVSPSSVKIERSHTFGQILWSFCKVSIAPAVEKTHIGTDERVPEVSIFAR